MIRLLLLPALFVMLTAEFIPSAPGLGTVEARCHPGDTGPEVMIDIAGLKDRVGKLKVEIYPGNDADWLADDNKLLMAGKLFRRVEGPVPAERTPHICVRLPAPGRIAVMVLHDRDSNHRFNWQHDGVGFSDNPRLGLAKPQVDAVAVNAGPGVTQLRVVMNYRNGLLSFGPIAGTP